MSLACCVKRENNPCTTLHIYFWLVLCMDRHRVILSWLWAFMKTSLQLRKVFTESHLFRSLFIGLSRGIGWWFTITVNYVGHSINPYRQTLKLVELISKKLPKFPKSSRTFWKISRNSQKFPKILNKLPKIAKIFQNSQKFRDSQKENLNFRDCVLGNSSEESCC